MPVLILRTSTSLTLVAQTGGTLALATYYYKIAAINNDDVEAPASAEFSVVVGGANNSVNVSWSRVEGAKRYRIYRTTTSESYPASSIVVTVNDPTTSYNDNGGTLLVGTPTKFETSNVRMLPVDERSMLTKEGLPGVENGFVQYSGSLPKEVQINLWLKTIAEFNALRGARGIEVYLIFAAHGNTFINEKYFVEHLSWQVKPGRFNSAGAVMVNCLVTFICSGSI